MSVNDKVEEYRRNAYEDAKNDGKSDYEAKEIADKKTVDLQMQMENKYGKGWNDDTRYTDSNRGAIEDEIDAKMGKGQPVDTSNWHAAGEPKKTVINVGNAEGESAESEGTDAAGTNATASIKDKDGKGPHDPEYLKRVLEAQTKEIDRLEKIEERSEGEQSRLDAMKNSKEIFDGYKKDADGNQEKIYTDANGEKTNKYLGSVENIEALKKHGELTEKAIQNGGYKVSDKGLKDLDKTIEQEEKFIQKGLENGTIPQNAAEAARANHQKIREAYEEKLQEQNKNKDVTKGESKDESKDKEDKKTDGRSMNTDGKGEKTGGTTSSDKSASKGDEKTACSCVVASNDNEATKPPKGRDTYASANVGEQSGPKQVGAAGPSKSHSTGRG